MFLYCFFCIVFLYCFFVLYFFTVFLYCIFVLFYCIVVFLIVKTSFLCRVDRAQENLHFLMDICEQALYILETEETMEVNAQDKTLSDWSLQDFFVI